MHKIAAFVRLSRLEFLVGGFAGFGLGAAVAAHAGARITLLSYAAGQLMVTAFHLMTHYANEFFDLEGDRFGAATPFSGGSGVLVTGTLPPQTARTAALVCAALGISVCAALAWTGPPLAAGLGIAIGGGAWAYSAPPLRFAARGWGELDTALVVAVLVPLAGYAMFTGSIDGRAFAATIAPAAAMFAMMIAVEWPDRNADIRAGKRNLLVRLGPIPAANIATLSAVAVVPCMALVLGFVTGPGGGVFALLAALPVLAFAACVRRSATPPDEVAARGGHPLHHDRRVRTAGVRCAAAVSRWCHGRRCGHLSFMPE